MHKYISLLLVFLININIWGQGYSPKPFLPDSIKILLNKKDYTQQERVASLTTALDYLELVIDLDNMEPYIQELEEISNNSNDLYYKALYNYYNGIFLSKDNSPLTIESYFKSLKQLYQLPESFQNQILKANNYNALGIYYTTNDMFLEAYEALIKGLEINKKINVSRLDFKLKKNLAIIYIKVGLDQEGFILNNELLNKYNDLKEGLIYKGSILNNIGGYYFMKSEYDSTMIYLDSIIYFKKIPATYTKMLINIGEVYIRKNEIDKAEKCFRESLKISFNNKIADVYNISTIQIGKIKIFNKQYDSALIYAEKAIELSKKNNFLTFEKDGLLLKKQTFEKLNKYKDYVETDIKYNAIQDSIAKIQNVESIKKAILKEKILEKERDFNKTIEEQKHRDRKEKASLILTITLLLIIVVILIYIYKLTINNKKRQEENINKELNLRNRELTSNMLLQAKSNDLLNNTISNLNDLIKKDKIEVNEVLSVISNIKQSINKNSFENFEYYFVKVHPSFFKNLIQDYPELTQHELKICAFIKLNLSTKDISSILNITPEGVRSAKTRIKKKLNLSDSEESITYTLAKY